MERNVVDEELEISVSAPIIGDDGEGETEEEDFVDVAEENNLGAVEFKLNGFCFDSGPYVSKTIWSRICRRAKKNMEIYTEALSNVLYRRYMRLPAVYLTDKEMMKSCDSLLVALRRFQDDISAITLEDFGIDRHSELSPNMVTLSFALGGRDICLHFFSAAMLLSMNGAYNESPSVSWNNPAIRKRTCKSLFSSFRGGAFDAQKLLSALSLHRCIPGNFPPATASHALERAAGILRNDRNEESNSLRLLDPCAGWGGRFLGFWFAPSFRTYIGIDPNELLYTPYKDMHSWLLSHAMSFRSGGAQPIFRLYQACAEEQVWMDLLFSESSSNDRRVFDVIFTSPPYFNTEVYSAVATQSCSRNEDYGEWKEHFLIPMLRNATSCLKPDGVVILNVSNAATCPTLVADTIAAMDGLQYSLHEVAVLNVPRRPNTAKPRGEPVLYFRKTASQ